MLQDAHTPGGLVGLLDRADTGDGAAVLGEQTGRDGAVGRALLTVHLGRGTGHLCDRENRPRGVEGGYGGDVGAEVAAGDGRADLDRGQLGDRVLADQGLVPARQDRGHLLGVDLDTLGVGRLTGLQTGQRVPQGHDPLGGQALVVGPLGHLVGGGRELGQPILRGLRGGEVERLDRVVKGLTDSLADRRLALHVGGTVGLDRGQGVGLGRVRGLVRLGRGRLGRVGCGGTVGTGAGHLVPPVIRVSVPIWRTRRIVARVYGPPGVSAGEGADIDGTVAVAHTLHAGVVLGDRVAVDRAPRQGRLRGRNKGRDEVRVDRANVAVATGPRVAHPGEGSGQTGTSVGHVHHAVYKAFGAVAVDRHVVPPWCGVGC